MRLNVLVVDDSAVMRAMVIRMLRLSGLPLGEVHQAGDGEEGLRLLDEHWIDLALVDINMPVMDGETMLERARAQPVTRDLAVIVVSTERSETRIERLRANGAEFVQKPFTAERLRETIIRMTGVAHEQQCGPLAGAGGELDF
jgi:two-component system, chemotaxis family, chemotaxis protein CheY